LDSKSTNIALKIGKFWWKSAKLSKVKGCIINKVDRRFAKSYRNCTPW